MSVSLWGIRLATPIFLSLLAVIALAGLWQLRRPMRRAALRYSSLRLADGAGTTWRVRLGRLLPLLRYAAAVLIILALARPQYGWHEREIHSYGVDIMMALDVSNSMQANDFAPNRLEAAKKVVVDFVDKRESDRIGVVIFGDAPFTLVPLTLDYEAIRSFTQRLTLERLGEQQTALGKGLAAAVRRLEDSEAQSKVVVLLTDGVDTVGGISPLDAAKAAEGLGVRVYTIGVGSDQPTDEMAALFGRMLFSPQVQFDEATLRQIAEETGGQYYHARDEKQLEEIYGEINELEKSRIEASDFVFYEEHMALAAFPALLLLLLELVLRHSIFLRIP